MTHPVKIPTDLDHPDRVLAGLTARQVVILAGTALVLYSGWLLARPWIPALFYLAGAAPFALAGIALALFRRDGMSLDRLAVAALAYRLRPRRLAGPPPPPTAPLPTWITERAGDLPTTGETRLDHVVSSWPGRTGRLRLPAGIDPFYGPGPGLLDLGAHGVALLAAATPVPFTMSSPVAQQTMVDAFARLLLGADAPIHLVVRALPLRLSPALAALAHAAARLPHPALRAAAAQHHQFLTSLDAARPLLTRQTILVLRDPNPAGNDARVEEAGERLGARFADAARTLAPAGIVLAALSAAEADNVLTAATHPQPDTPPPHATPPPRPTHWRPRQDLTHEATIGSAGWAP